MTNIVVVAHTARTEAADLLAAQVDADWTAWDNGTLGCEVNHQRAWAWHQQHTLTGWAVVLEDDAQPVHDFRDQLEAALTVAPTPIVSLYLGTGYPSIWQPRIRKAINAAHTANWLLCGTLLHAVAVAVRADLLPAIQVDRDMPIDNALSNWAKRHDTLVAYTMPSLVEHADEPPVITQRYDRQPRTEPRKAHRVGTRPRWTRTAAPIGQ